MLRVLVQLVVVKAFSAPFRLPQIARSSCQIRMSSFSSPSSNLLACQVDSYASEGVSKVIDCTKTGDVYQATLENSVLYPEGGGQPWDLGTVNGIKVQKVAKGVGVRSVIVDLEEPVEAGADVVCKVDWARRYDFMQQHTAQHLFSAVADKLFKAETTGWALGTETVSVDLASPVFLTAAQIEEIETESNRMIASGAAVNWKVYSKAQILGQDSTGKDDSAVGAGELSLLRGGPKGAALELDELRMVHIEGLDLNPCGGTHLRGLSEINLLKVMGFEKDAGRGCVRVRFLSGQRALNYFKDCIQRESSLSSTLCVPPVQQPSAVEKLLKDKRDNAKRFDTYAEELAELYAISLHSDATKALNAADSVVPEVPVYAYHRPGADLKFLVKAASTVLTLHQKRHPSSTKIPLVYLSGDSNMPVFTSSLDPPKAAKPVKKGAKSGADDAKVSAPGEGLSGAFVLFGAEATVAALKEPLMGAIGGKGGGRPGRLQGTAVSLEALDEVRKLLLGAELS